MGLFPQKMLEVTVITPTEDFPKIIISLAETDIFMPKEITEFEELENYCSPSRIDIKRQLDTSFENLLKLIPEPKEKLIKKLKRAFQKQPSLDPIFKDWENLEDIENKLQNEIQELIMKIEDSTKILNRTKANVEISELIEKGFRLLETQHPYEISQQQDILAGILTTSKEKDAEEFLNEIEEKEIIPLVQNKFFLYAQAKKGEISKLKKNLSSVNWYEYNYTGAQQLSNLEIEEGIHKECIILRKELEKIEHEVNEFVIKNKERIMALKLSIESYGNVLKTYISAKKTIRTVVFQGWVADREFRKFQNYMSEFQETVLLADEPEEEIKNIPVLPAKNPVLRSFQSIVGLYGLPSAKEVDPTIFFVFTFSLFYGMMFGDAGHGLIFIVFGTLGMLARGLKKNVRRMFILVFAIGLSSFIWGAFIFGEAFGFHLAHEWHIESFLGAPYPLLDPNENIIDIFNISLIIGAIQIFLGLALRIINQIIRKEVEELLKETGAQIFLYAAILYILNILGIIRFGNITIPTYIGMITLVIGVGLALLGQGIASIIIKEKRKNILGNFLSGIGMGIMNLLESFSSFISNTISYGRLLAMLIAHVVFLSVINILALQFNLVFIQIIILIIGNIFVIVLEGVLVFVQTLRLHFYEFFSKFYEGSGIEYKPLFVFNKKMDLNKYG